MRDDVPVALVSCSAYMATLRDAVVHAAPDDIGDVDEYAARRSSFRDALCARKAQAVHNINAAVRLQALHTERERAEVCARRATCLTAVHSGFRIGVLDLTAALQDDIATGYAPQSRVDA